MPYDKVSDQENASIYGDNRRRNMDPLLGSKRPLDAYPLGSPSRAPAASMSIYSRPPPPYGAVPSPQVNRPVDMFPPPLPAPSMPMNSVYNIPTSSSPHYPNLPAEYAGLPIIEERSGGTVSSSVIKSEIAPAPISNTPLISESHIDAIAASSTIVDKTFKDSFEMIEGVDGDVTVSTSQSQVTNLHPVVILVVLVLLYFALKYWGDALDSWLTKYVFGGVSPSWKASVVMATIFTIVIVVVLLFFNINITVFTKELSLS